MLTLGVRFFLQTSPCYLHSITKKLFCQRLLVDNYAPWHFLYFFPDPSPLRWASEDFALALLNAKLLSVTMFILYWSSILFLRSAWTRFVAPNFFNRRTSRIGYSSSNGRSSGFCRSNYCAGSFKQCFAT